MNKEQVIKDILMKYCDPKPEFDGFTAGDLAKLIMVAIGEYNERMGLPKLI